MNSLNYTILEWDSSFFGYQVGKLQGLSISYEGLDSLMKIERTKKTKLVYWFVQPTDLCSLELAKKLKLQPVDIKVTYQKETRKNLIDENITSLLNCELSPKLLSLAYQSGWQSRFKTDSKFNNFEFERLYATWIEKSIKGESSLDVLGYTKNDEVLGLVTIDHKKDNTASIGLIAVDSSARSIGIGTKLMEASESLSFIKGIRNLTVATQRDNTQACNFYKSIGYDIIEEVYIYHIWL